MEHLPIENSLRCISHQNKREQLLTKPEIHTVQMAEKFTSCQTCHISSRQLGIAGRILLATVTRELSGLVT